VADLPAGRLLPAAVAGLDIVLTRVGAASYAYRDGCPACASSLLGSAVERRLGDPIGSAVLTCPGCRQHFDVCHAGAGLDDPGLHLEPLPLLERNGRVEVAVPTAVQPDGALT
jgi:nitrite reductase/ring-hydroxylating ferredoxin subunit